MMATNRRLTVPMLFSHDSMQFSVIAPGQFVRHLVNDMDRKARGFDLADRATRVLVRVSTEARLFEPGITQIVRTYEIEDSL